MLGRLQWKEQEEDEEAREGSERAHRGRMKPAGTTHLVDLLRLGLAALLAGREHHAGLEGAPGRGGRGDEVEAQGKTTGETHPCSDANSWSFEKVFELSDWVRRNNEVRRRAESKRGGETGRREDKVSGSRGKRGERIECAPWL